MTAEASCTVPLNRNLKLEADTLRADYINPYGPVYSNFLIRIFFTDFPGEDNYYRLYCEQETYKFSPKPINYTTRFSGFTNEFFSDNGKKGEKSLITSININDIKNIDSSFFRIYIFNTDKAYYDYHISLKNYNSGEDPFTEASPIYSNVTGGLGIFAAYTVDSLVFRLK
jgi:hypothetical protein